MKSLLLTVTLFGLLAVLQAQDDLPFLPEDKNVSGTWYRKAKVFSLNIPEMETPMENFPFVVRALNKGTLEVTDVSMVNGQCVEIGFLLKKTEKPGQYTAYGDSLLIYIYELPEMDHYILYSECNVFEEKVYVGELIGKDPKENQQALEDFKKFAQRKGFTPENIIVLEQRGICVPEVYDDTPPNCKSEVKHDSNV